MDEKFLSIIVAAYQAEEYIGRCIRSVFCTLPSKLADAVEVIVIDDASIDKTAERAEELGFPIRLIRLGQNCGSIAKTRNIGLRAARGRYLTFLDADDYYADGAVAALIGYLKQYTPDIVRFGYTEVYPPNNRTKIPKWNPKSFCFVKKEDFKREVYPHLIGGIGLNSVCLAAFRRSMLGALCFPENFLTAEDVAFSIEAYTAAQSVLFLPDRLYCYFQTGKGMTGAGTGIIKKYQYNFMLVLRMLKKLKVWGLATPRWCLKTVLRPFAITLDKIKRMKNDTAATMQSGE